MELNKKNLKSILNNFIAGVTLVLVAIFVALCFVTPSRVQGASTLTKEDIKAYNIYFVSALTKSRAATGIEKVQLTGRNESNSPYTFYAHQYDYNDYLTSENLFYGKSSNVIQDDVNGSISVMTSPNGSSPLSEKVFIPLEANQYKNHYGFIPYGANYFNNVAGAKELIFYNEINNNDYVLLDNYELNGSNTDKFNVENFYLSFGTPYIDDHTTTPLNELKVSAKLYSESRVHNIVLNDVLETKVDSGDQTKDIYYWNQYFDLKNLSAYITNDPNSDTYAIENQQGRYEFTFKFVRYNSSFEAENMPEEEFTYSFYLLDSADYTDYPTINNAQIIGDIAASGTEYFYNFTTDNPYVNYDPTRYNLSYTRKNNKSINNIFETITSTFVQETYSKDGKVYPKGILTYYNGSDIVKQVFILTEFNSERNVVEHLYLSRTNPTTTFNLAEYQSFIDSVKNDSLKFEYKTTTILTKTEQNFSITDYKTTKYENFELIADNIDSVNGNIATLKDGKTVELENATSVDYTIINDSEIKLKDSTSSIIKYDTQVVSDELIGSINSGVIVNTKTLGIKNDAFDEGQSNDTKVSHTKYKLSSDSTSGDTIYTLSKTYYEYDTTGESVLEKNLEDFAIIQINTYEDGPYEIVDSIHKNITIKYVVESKEITSIKLYINDKVDVLSVNSNQHELETLLNIKENSRLSLDYTYDLVLDELGIYEFTYSYVSYTDKHYINSTNPRNETTLSSLSSNYTAPVNYSKIVKNNTPDTDTREEQTGDNNKLYIVVSAEVKDTKFNLLGKEYKYNAGDAYFTDSDNNEHYFNNVGTNEQLNAIPVEYKLNTANGYIVEAYFEVGTFIKTTINKTYTHLFKEKAYRTVSTTQISTYYSISVYDDTIASLKSDSAFKSFGETLERLKAFTKDNQFTTSETITSEPRQGYDKMHIFGSIAYFSKTDVHSDSNYSKLEQIDSKIGANYISDVTSRTTGMTITPANLSNIKSKIAPLLTKNEIIVTDVTPILWNNFSTLYYSGKTSQSYVYRYSKWHYDESEHVIPDGTPVTSTYTKDIYCQRDGLYEVIVFYTYDNMPTQEAREKVYFQVFTFIIDNKPPKIEIDVKNDKGNYESLDLNNYTNKDVRISWDIPSYFKHDVYLEINKEYYNDTNTTDNFNATFKQENTIVNTGNATYVNGISEMVAQDKKYYVYLQLDKPSLSYSMNGNYEVILHYGTNGRSTYSEDFIIDKMNIDGLTIESVMKNDDGTYKKSSEDIGNSQITNKNFTFRFNSKASGADIFVYYDKIELASSDGYDKLINFTSGQGITTKYEVQGFKEDLSEGTPYVYEYTHERIGEYKVDNKNVLTSNTSCLFLFRLEDEAGNTARFVVFYDKTEPRFLTSPEPDPDTKIINDTTRVVWGDYKAIKISTDVEIDDSAKFNNYKKSDENTEKLNIVLGYLRHYTNNFNSIKVEEYNDDYYLLIPITEVRIEDRDYLSEPFDPLKNGNIKDYYFFPTNPINNNQITLPNYVDGKVEVNQNGAIQTTTYTVASSSTENVLDNYGNPIERYITIEYYLSGNTGTTATIKGVIGEGKFFYAVYDKIENKTTGLLWMNLDKTETLAYATFDYTDKISKAEELIGKEVTSSASSLFISSLVAKQNEIPQYEVTGKYYPYDANLYKDYRMTAIDIEQDGEASYLKINMVKKSDSSIKKEVKLQLTDEYGTDYPIHSYPYSLDGTSLASDSKGNPVDIYSKGSQFKGSDTTRKYSLALNTNTDTERQSLVTQEGLYILRRTYTDPNLTEEMLGSDQRVIYRVYYIDRSGIINISANNSAGNKLYSIGQDIQFTLGATQDPSYHKVINAETIQNNQSKTSQSNTSNADYTSSNQFDTNKIQVEFNLTYDKYNFSRNVSNSNSLLNQLYNKSIADDTGADLKTYLNGYLLNTAFYQNKYKIDLQLSVGDINYGDVVINESEQKFNTNAINHYLKNNPMINATTRGNDYNFYLDTNPSLYYIGMKDQAGYELFNEDGTVKDKNYLANSLKITFDISHTPPVGNAYGKYYGRQNYEVITDGNSYELLKYLEEGNGQKGQLELLSETLKHTESSKDGYYAQLFSTNNETLVFAFAITNDEFQAKIDHKNIKIYKGAIDEKNLIFDRVNADFRDTTLVKKERQKTSFIENEVNGTTYYAIIIFDNNLDDIVDPNDPIEKEYLNFRLLDRKDNPDKEKYFVKINYIGNSGDYVGQDGNANEISFYNTTYDITIDRIKPTYNLTKLMNLDKYVYNTVESIPTSSNYETLFERYKPFYNFSLDAEQDFERSDLEKYFFALDTRKDSEFVFESIDDLDNSKNIYIRQVDKNNYKFSVTPDDYKAYYNATYLQGYPQFTPSSAELIEEAKFGKDDGQFSLDPTKYYRIAFDLDNSEKRNSDNALSTNFLKNHGILRENTYYEIIEADEAGNHRVYGIYIPQESKDEISYSYQTNSNVSSTKIVNILNQEGNTPYVTSSGMSLKFLKIKTYDNFLKAKINILTEKIDHDIEIILDPNKLIVTVINRTTDTTMNTYEVLSKDKDNFANTEAFITAINDLINYYNELINNKNHSYYSEYGYNVTINLINRIGVSMKDTTTLYNYEINYVVAGSTLYPTFTDYATNFTMKLDGQKGSTYLTDITVYKFNKVWSQINSDNSPTPQIFDKSDAELKKEIIYTFNRGIYRFVFTDNFGRVNEFFYEYGISSSQTGGSLSYAGSTSTMSDGYIYSSNNVTYTYDSSVYNIYIKFVGKVPNEFGEYDIYTDEQNQVIYSSNISYTPEYLAKFGIKAITSGNTTTITFSGVKDNSKANGTIDLSKYHIKTILASTSTNYKWNDENKNTGIGNNNASNNKDVFVYDKQIAIYKAVPNTNIKNLSGNILDTREHLNLTEDIELITTWSKDVATNERFGFNPRILLTRTYNDNGTIRTTTTRVDSGYTITLPGDYTAYTVNDLGTKSSTISFTRGEGEISMYAVYAVNSQMSSEKKLTPSTLIDNKKYGEENKVLFTYFITDDYFKYKNSSSNTNITIANILNNEYSNVESLSTIFVCDTSANKYLDVRVNSNLSIKAEIHEVGVIDQNNSTYPYVMYKIYSTTKAGETYVYRFIQVVFVEENPEHGFADTTLTNQSETNNLAETTSLISSTADTMYLTFKFGNEYDGLYLPQGDTVYIDRYYNGNFVETYVIDMSIHNSHNTPTFEMLLNQVGLHEFVIRDLAGRTHKFHDSEKLQIYLINEILFTVNDNTPINNQVFNGNVDIDIVFKLDTLQLYNQRSLNIVVTKNGQVTNMPNSSGQIQLTETGYYSITMSAIVDGTSTQVSTIYNFVILDEKIANNTFSISKGTGFAIEKLIKIVNGEETDITDTYSVSNGSTTSNLLLWLTHSEQGNSIFDVTLKYYDNITDSDMSFNFRIWINNESPVFISSVPAGTKTKDSITVHFNPGLIYTQIGKGYITLNDTVIATIDENSQSVVETVSIEEKGTYWIRLYSNDGTLIDTYKFTKQEPMNKMTKIIIIVVIIVALVVVGLFFFLRRKGRYR